MGPDLDDSIARNVEVSRVEARAAEDQGLRVIFGDAGDETPLLRADIEGRHAVIALTTNRGINLAVLQKARREYRVPVLILSSRSA